MDVGKNTSSGNSNSSQELVEFLIVLYSKSDVTRDNTALLVVTSGVSGEFENLGTEVLEDGSEVDRRSSSHSCGVLSLSEVTSDTTNRELETSLLRAGHRTLLGSASSLSFSFGEDGQIHTV